MKVTNIHNKPVIIENVKINPNESVDIPGIKTPTSGINWLRRKGMIVISSGDSSKTESVITEDNPSSKRTRNKKDLCE